jgi:hypothetical protein
MEYDKQLLENQFMIMNDLAKVMTSVGVIEQKQKTSGTQAKKIEKYIEGHPKKCPYNTRKEWKRSTRIGFIGLNIAIVLGLVKLIDFVLGLIP